MALQEGTDTGASEKLCQRLLSFAGSHGHLVEEMAIRNMAKRDEDVLNLLNLLDVIGFECA